MYELLSIFGGTGAVLLAIGGCVWKQLQSYHTKFEKEPSNLNKPIVALPNTWEHSHTEPLATSFRRMVYAKEIAAKKQWQISMKKGEGSVYVYRDHYQKPSTNDGHYFLRVRLRNVPEDAAIQFIHKYWTGEGREWKAYSKTYPPNRQSLVANDGVHIYFQPSLIDQHDVTKEQVGIHFDAKDVAYDNCIVEEVYDKQKSSICNVVCCRRHWGTILYRKKKEHRVS